MTTSQLDLGPAARRVAKLVEGVPDGALDRPTPCAEYCVGDLLDHIAGAALAFRHAAVKDPLEGAPAVDGDNLDVHWRTSIPASVLALAEAWAAPDAWEGMTRVGGVDLPGEVAGVVGLDEMIIHGWDLAKATGQPAGYEGPELAAVHATVAHFRESGIDGLFGPLVEVPEDAPALDRILGLAGRDPGWRPPTSGAGSDRSTS